MKSNQSIAQNLSFGNLVNQILKIDSTLRDGTVKAINRMATLRNWLIGAYIVEYEQHGSDRAQYGKHLIQSLSQKLGKGFTSSILRKSRSFYYLYPQIKEAFQIRQTLSVELWNEIQQTLSVEFDKEGENVKIVKSDPYHNLYYTPCTTLLSRLSFSHFIELVGIEDPLVRYFYEVECIKNTWSVRELRRQIATNLHIRVGWSVDKVKAMKIANDVAEKDSSMLQIRDPYVFEFLGLKPHETLTESDIENALIENLKDFLLELGKGFCFEGRQKRIIIDDEYYNPDLIFYNRILHCGVIVEIKNDMFRHEHLGQLNAYVGYYAENEMQPGDNPPIGILLCTKKGKKMVEYALGAMSHDLFVSTYQLELPNKEELELFIKTEIGK